MQPPSTSKCIKKIKQLEKYNVKYKRDNWNLKSENRNLTNINQNLKDEIFFLKRFIQDLGEKSDITHQDNIKYVNKLNEDIKKINKESDKYYRENQELIRQNKELTDKNKEINEKYSKNMKSKENFKKTIKSVFKKIYTIQKENKLIQEDYNELSDDYEELNEKYEKINKKYDELFNEYREYQRNLEQSLEESQPLLGPSKMPQFDKLKKYSCANFRTAKKIENKKNNKDNISFINKPMSNFNNTGGLPTIWSELQDFFVPPQSSKSHTSRSQSSNKCPQHPYKQSHVDEVRRINHDIAVENSKLHHTISELNIKLNKRDNECDNLRYKIQNLKADLSSLKQEMASSPKQDIVCAMLNKNQPTNSNSGKVLEKEYAKLNKSYKELQKRYTDVRKECDEYITKASYSADSNKNEIERLTKEIAQIKYEKQILNEEIKNMQNMYSSCTIQSNNRIGSYQTMISNMQKELDESKNYKEKYNELIKVTDKENEKHAMEINKLINDGWKQSDVKSQLDMTNLKKTLEVKEKELDSLKEMNDILSSEVRECNKVQSQLEDELETLINQDNDSVSRSDLYGLEADLVEIEKENSELRNEVIELNDKLAIAVIDKTDLDDQLALTCQDLDDLTKQHESLLDEYESLSLTHSKLENEYSTENQRLTTEYEQANKLVAQLTLDCDRLEKNNARLDDGYAQLDDSYQHLKGDYNSKVEEVNQLMNETAKFNDVYNEMRQNLTNEIAKQQEHVLNLEAENIATREMNNGLAKLLDEKEADQKKNYVMKGEFVALEADYEGLNNRYDDLDFKYNELTAKYESLKEDYTESVQKHNDIDNTVKRLTDEITSLDNENVLLKNEVVGLEDEAGELSDKLGKAIVELDEAKWDNNELATNYKDLRDSEQDKVKQILALKGENALLTTDLEDATESNTVQQTQIEEVRKALAETTARLSMTEEALVGKEQLYELAQIDLVNCNNMLQSEYASINKLNKELKSQTVYTESLLDAHKTLNNDHTMLKGKYNSAKTLRDTLEEKYNQLINETSLMSEKINQLTRENKELTKERDEMKPVYDKVNAKLKDWDVVDDIDFTEKSDEVERIL